MRRRRWIQRGSSVALLACVFGFGTVQSVVAATVEFAGALPIPDACRRTTIDAGVAKVVMAPGRVITLGPRPTVELPAFPISPFSFTVISNDRGASPAWQAIAPGSDAPGLAMLQVTDPGSGSCTVRYTARVTYLPEELVGYDPNAYPGGVWVGPMTASDNVELVPLDDVRELHIADAADAPLQPLTVSDWRLVAGRARPGFSVVLDAAATGRVPTIELGFGADPSSPVRVAAVSSTSLDLDDDARADLSWTGGAPPAIVVRGTPGSDRIDLTGIAAGRVIVRAGAGDDDVSWRSRSPATIEAGDGADVVVATAAAVVDGGGGSDRVDVVGEGVAPVTSGPGDDVIRTGFATLHVHAGAGDDSVQGGTGNDVIDAGAGADVVDSGAGDDRLQLGAGDDHASGGRGKDQVRGDDGDDVVSGDAGPDQVYGGRGDDRVLGGSGSDFVQPNDGDDRSWGGSGNDTMGVAMGDQRSPDRRPGDDDVFWGGPGDDSISDDSARGRGYGGPGRDYLKFQGGTPLVDGGPGDDYVFVRTVAAAEITLGPGNDVLRMGAISPADVATGWRLRVACGSGIDWVSWQPLHVAGCEWQQQLDIWDRAVGRPIRDDTDIPPQPCCWRPPDTPWR